MHWWTQMEKCLAYSPYAFTCECTLLPTALTVSCYIVFLTQNSPSRVFAYLYRYFSTSKFSFCISFSSIILCFPIFSAFFNLVQGFLLFSDYCCFKVSLFMLFPFAPDVSTFSCFHLLSPHILWSNLSERIYFTSTFTDFLYSTYFPTTTSVSLPYSPFAFAFNFISSLTKSGENWPATTSHLQNSLHTFPFILTLTSSYCPICSNFPYVILFEAIGTKWIQNCT